MPALPLSKEQKADSDRLKALFKAWQSARRSNGLEWGQEWAADQLGFGQSATSQYLNGKIPLNPDAASKFAKLIGVSVSSFSLTLAAEIARIAGAEQVAPGRHEPSNAEPAGRPRSIHRITVRGAAKMGAGGYYEEIDGGGWVEGSSADPEVYALRVKGDSMHPAIRNGSVVVVEPNGQCIPTEYVAIALRDGQKMVKELVVERADEVVVESVNGNHRQTISRADILQMHPVASVVSPSKWRAE